MSSFTPVSTVIEDGKTSVTATFVYGPDEKPVAETQIYVFDGELSADEVLTKLTELTAEYQSKWEAMQEPVTPNDVEVPLETVTVD